MFCKSGPGTGSAEVHVFITTDLLNFTNECENSPEVQNNSSFSFVKMPRIERKTWVSVQTQLDEYQKQGLLFYTLFFVT